VTISITRENADLPKPTVVVPHSTIIVLRRAQ
jgi:hypothetical protein